MNIADLGPIDGPMLVFGGPYSNLQATRALRRVAEQHDIPPERCLCTGDIVAYCADAAAAVAEIRDWGCAVVAGNCERQLAAGALDCGCGFEAGTACDLLSAGWFGHAAAEIAADDRAWMAALPDAVAFSHQGLTGLAVHGGVSDISRFLWSVSPEQAFCEELSLLPAQPDLVIAGHSGIPFQRQIGATRWINAGVIGMPPHDGAAQTRYAVLQEGRAEIHHLSYDWRAAQQAMVDVGLTQGYHASLGTGVWPSEEVLPHSLRRSASVASG